MAMDKDEEEAAPLIVEHYADVDDRFNIQEKRHYTWPYSEGDWLEGFLTEWYDRRDEGRLNGDHTFCLPPGKEYVLFAECFPPAQSNQQSHTQGWSKLPTEIKATIFNMTFKFEEVLKVIATAKYISDPPATHAEELVNINYFFTLVAKVPKALVPGDNVGINCFGEHYWTLPHPRNLLAAGLVCKEFNKCIKSVFFGKNVFEVHDGTPCLAKPDVVIARSLDANATLPPPDRRQFRPDVVAHRWLELMLKFGCLELITGLNVDIDIEGDQGRTKWHVRRTFQAIIYMPKLRRLVVNVNMCGFISASEPYCEDVHFRNENACGDWEEWPGLRMLAWATAAVAPAKLKFWVALRVFVPQYRAVEPWVKRLMELAEDEREKFWVEEDWSEPPEGFAGNKIAEAIAGIRMRQRAGQRRYLELLDDDDDSD